MAGKTTEIWQEGLIIPPVKLLKKGEENKEILEIILRNTRVPEERIGDLGAQIGANELGSLRLLEFIDKYGLNCFRDFTNELIEYSRKVTEKRLAQIPKGTYSAVDWMDDDGVENKRVKIKVKVEVGNKIKVDFEGSDPQKKGNINAPLAVTKSGVYYAFRCLLREDIPLNDGFYRNIEINAPKGCFLNPYESAAVAAGNVETSQRIVDVIFLALAKALPSLIPAQSQGTMNNLSMGNEHFTYYETIGGGAGALSYKNGESGIQVHMTNTKNTPIEVIESTYPLRVEKYAIRRGSGGLGKYKGGDGIIRGIRVLEDCILSIQSERRKLAPKGVEGGRDGSPGKNYLLRKGKSIPLPSKISMEVKTGDVIVIETPGGGGWGKARD
jgi:N-methylhydantoinase B